MTKVRTSSKLTDADLELFHKVLADVTPLRPEPAPKAVLRGDASTSKTEPALAAAGETRVRGTPASAGNQAFPAALADHGAGRVPGLDKRTAQRLSRGKTEIDGRIDLHGMTQAEARAALTGFVSNGHRHGRRCLLVITGKGRRIPEDSHQPHAGPGGAEPGILRRMVPRWLEEAPLADRVLAYSPAQPRHGGAGALYVLLKRRRER
jgi:DNA-nicking Smr family endonuclease